MSALIIIVRYSIHGGIFHVCSPLQVVKNAKGKLRLVIDLRYVNRFLNQYKFKYEGLDLISSLFKKGNFAFSFDLKSG